jgi:hypothetical protein
MAYYTRLTYNSKDWRLPSGPIGKCGDDNSLLWEFTAGFGFEEWYRNPKFQVKDENGVTWQFGYWQCFNNPNNHKAAIYKKFDVYTRICNYPLNTPTRNIKVANYKEVHVLDEKERSLIHSYFQNEIIEIRGLLAQTSRRDGNLIDINNNFDGEPSGQSRFNIRFRLEDEDYVFANSTNMPIKIGDFELYLK